jgi:hypothetical protein
MPMTATRRPKSVSWIRNTASNGRIFRNSLDSHSSFLSTGQSICDFVTLPQMICLLLSNKFNFNSRTNSTDTSFYRRKTFRQNGFLLLSHNCYVNHKLIAPGKKILLKRNVYCLLFLLNTGSKLTHDLTVPIPKKRR